MSEVDPKRKPAWLKTQSVGNDDYLKVQKIVNGLNLHTVCKEACCPNRESVGVRKLQHF